MLWQGCLVDKKIHIYYIFSWQMKRFFFSYLNQDKFPGENMHKIERFLAFFLY